METKNIYCFFNKCIFLILNILIIVSCTSSKPKDTPSFFESPHADRSYVNPPPQPPPLTSTFEKTEGATETPVPQTKNNKRISLIVGGAGPTSFALVGVLKRLKLDGFQIENIYSTGLPSLFSVAYGNLKTIHDLEWFTSRLPEKDISNPSRMMEFAKKNLSPTDLQDLRTPVTITVNADESYDKGSFEYPLQKTMESSGQDGFPFLLNGPSPKFIYIDLYGDSCEGARKKDLLCKNLATAYRNLKEQKSILLKVRIKDPNESSFKRKIILKGFQEAASISKKLKLLK